jgi:hypothetical protein
LPCLSAAGQILREHLIDDSNFEAQTCACSHSPTPRRRWAEIRSAG